MKAKDTEPCIQWLSLVVSDLQEGVGHITSTASSWGRE